MSVHLSALGSNIERWRVDWSIGKTFAEGWLEPLRQKAGFWYGRTRAVNHTRPCSSIMGLWLLVMLSQIGLGPQCAEGCMGSSRWFGVFGSRTGCSTSATVFVLGSRIGT